MAFAANTAQLCRPAAPALGVHCSYSTHTDPLEIAYGGLRADCVGAPPEIGKNGGGGLSVRSVTV